MWLLTKADKTHITIGSGRQEACPVCYVKYMFIERHIGSVHERKKVSQQNHIKGKQPFVRPLFSTIFVFTYTKMIQRPFE